MRLQTPGDSKLMLPKSKPSRLRPWRGRRFLWNGARVRGVLELAPDRGAREYQRRCPTPASPRFSPKPHAAAPFYNVRINVSAMEEKGQRPRLWKSAGAC